MIADRVALVTGATSGIGQWTALGLARVGFRVIAIGRNPERVQALTAWLRERERGARVDTLLADLSVMSDVRKLAAAVRDQTGRLDLLVNNAGVFAHKRTETSEGHERSIAVNHLAPFLLTRELLSILESTPGSRIVNVGSSSADHATIDVSDLEWRARPWSMMKAYGESKLALMIASFELARRLGPSPAINVVHPGSVATRIGEVGGLWNLLWGAMKPFLLTAENGARTTLHVATDARVASVTGRYFKKSSLAEPNPLVNDRELASTLWSATEALLDRTTAAPR